MDIQLYVRHKLTAYHWRYDRSQNNSNLFLCSCGWEHKMFRKLKWKTRFRSIVCFFRGGHDWGETEESHAGPVDFEESEDTLVSRYKQCEFCWKIKEVNA